MLGKLSILLLALIFMASANEDQVGDKMDRFEDSMKIPKEFLHKFLS